jgi:hypothetical protein
MVRRSNAFEGIQPTFKQVPPRVEYFSIIAVLKLYNELLIHIRLDQNL